MKLQNKKQKIKILILFCGLWTMVYGLCGCEAFVRKFTRKPKKEETKKEIVLVPQDYSPSDMPVEERYRQYFLFWKSWQEELISALSPSESHKRRKGCAEEAIKNLGSLRPLLYEEKQKDLDVYLDQMRRLKDQISQDIYGANLTRHKTKAESLRREVLRVFSYPKVKAHLR